MKKSFVLLSSISLCLLTWAQVSSFAEKNNKEDEIPLEKIIVTDRGYYVDPVYYPLAVPASEESTTSTVTLKEIQAEHKQTAVETIENVPGVNLERQGRKYPVRIKIRGERNVNVLINGSSPGQDYRILSALPSSLIEEVDVIRDSSYLAYGSPNTSSSAGTSGYGGVVNIKLKRPENEHGTEAKVEIGSFNSQDEGVTTAGKLKDINYLLNIENYKSEGPKGENANQMFTGVTSLLNKQYGDYSSRINMLLHFDEGYIGFQKSMANITRRYDVWEYDPSMNAMVNLDILHAWSDRSSTNLTLYNDYQQTTLIQDNTTGGSPGYASIGAKADMHNRDMTNGISIRQTFSIPTINTLRFGAQFNKWDCPTGKLFYEGSAREENDYGAYMHDELRLMKDKFIVDGGIRWDHKYVAKGIYVDETSTTGTTTQVKYYNKWLDPNINSAIGLTVWPFEKHGFSTRYSISSQADAIFADSTGNLLGNQTENRYDVSYIGKWSKKINFTLTGFQKDISNMPKWAGGAVYTADSVKRYGAEAEIKGNLLEGLSYFGNYSQIYSRDKTNSQPEKDIPQYVASTGIDYQHNGWNFNATVKRVSDYEDNSLVIGSGYVSIGNYWQGDLNAGYAFESNNRIHTVYAGVRNIGDVRYQTVPGYRDFGRTIYGGYKVKF